MNEMTLDELQSLIDELKEMKDEENVTLDVNYLNSLYSRIRLRVLAKKYIIMLHYIVKKTDVVQQLEGHYETMKILYSLM